MRKKKTAKKSVTAKAKARAAKRRRLNTITGYYPNPTPRAKPARRNPTTVKIGELLGIMYSRDGVKYLHKFTKDRPELHTTMQGTQMHIKGGKYHWTPFGVK